ncbi:MAG: hypothetical protein M0Q14_05985 [Tissierellaceae bacterium]|nr:hypothetical protein [Tissierellaceae bacterium]
MSSSLEYTRKFVILKRDYATVEKGIVRGHCKVEKRGPRNIFSVSIDNGEIEDFYDILLIANDKSRSIWYLGKIFTDEIGKGKDEYSFTQREVESSGFPVNHVTGILVMKDNEVILGGYTDGEDGTIEDYIENFLQRKEEYEEESLDMEIEENAVEKLEHQGELDVEPVVELVAVPVVEPVAEPIETPVEPIEEIEEGPLEGEDLDLEEDYDDDVTESDGDRGDYGEAIDRNAQTVNYVLSILRFFPYIVPFKHNLKGYNWWLIDLDIENEYRSFLPYFSHVLGGDNERYYDNHITTCNQLVNKYQHYLFGLYNEDEKVKYFLYGIPGTFTTGEHPNGGMSGFNTWMEGRNIEGYWIIYIDPSTGKPVEVSNPMLPVD